MKQMSICGLLHLRPAGAASIPELLSGDLLWLPISLSPPLQPEIALTLFVVLVAPVLPVVLQFSDRFLE